MQILKAAVAALRMATLGTALIACQPPTAPAPSAPRQALPATSAAPDIAATLGRFAANLLVLPLLDDAELPRFTLSALPLLCAGQSEASIDGHPLVDQTEVPHGSFVLHWRLRGYCPFGAPGPELIGDISVLVLRDDEAGLQAIILPGTSMQ